ncbi:exopolysaccharide biosynthesis polyprenyl glycosylphosphotransferase [Lachnospiraceae bacterium NK3A20]|nr:exopolysaccharide biosynthesis polyprenyl glycosylphosphotransferase [Lachnospiraceae bacterium NK3A20]
MMNQRSKTAHVFIVWVIDTACIAISYLLATQIRFGGSNDYGSKTLHYMVMVVLLMFCAIYDYFTNANSRIMKRGYFGEFVCVLQFDAVMILVSLAVVFFAQWSYILSRSVILNFAWMNLILTLVGHILYKRVVRRAYSADTMVTKVLAVTEQDKTDETIAKLHRMLDDTAQIVGSVSVRELSEQNYRNITGTLTQIPFDEVYIDTPGMTEEELAPLIEGFEEMGVAVHYSLHLPNLGAEAGRIENFGTDTVITYSMVKANPGQLLIKRLFDILGGIVGLVLTGIIFLFLAPAIKMDSPGPVFFSQTRVGKNGRRFRIWKFRSMYQDAEERLKELESQNKVKGLMFKMDNDPRITKVGSFIRKTSLDEFPQFWNVLKGDMSLVGTRPPTEKEFAQYNEHYRRRLSMTPGLTGMWQVSGRSSIDDFDEVVKLDLQYIDNWSLALDFRIIVQTIGVVLLHKGAE